VPILAATGRRDDPRVDTQQSPVAGAMTDPALETLFAPFLEGRLEWPVEGALFLRARAGAALQSRSWSGLVCQQSFKPDVDALRRIGMRMQAGALGGYPLVLLLAPRQRAEARALMACALAATNPGGRIVACAANDEGARSSEADLRRIAGPVKTLSKNKCRVFWTEPLRGPANPTLMQEWSAMDAVRPVAGGRFLSRPGVFAWDRLDQASQLLATHLPRDLAGRAADLGSGFGYLSDELLTRCPGVTRLDVYEAEARALELSRWNLAAFEQRVSIEYHWHDVLSGLPCMYDLIIMNPPFHVGSGGAERPDLGRRFIAVAAESLNAGGRLWLVANRHLPYETVLNASFGRVRILTQENGYKVVEAVKAAR
jgi:16S rRNA (guanine1207-N2)-methyltransferase